MDLTSPASHAREASHDEVAGIGMDLTGKTLSTLFPDLAAVRIPAESYVSPEAGERERRELFGRAWQYAGFLQDVGEPGKYFIRELPLLKASVLVTRALDGSVRAFHNICRHRCNKLVTEAQAGSARRFTCAYHGWTYDLEGKLIGLPDKDGLLDPQKLGLLPVAVDTWCGQVFVNLSPQPEQTLKEYLGSAYDWKMKDFDWDQPYESWTWRTHLSVNWKVLLDLFSEGYHVRFVHQDSVAKLYTDESNPFNHLPVVEFGKRHRRVSVYATHGRKIDAVATIARKFGGDAMSRTRDATSGVRSVQGLNFSGMEKWGFDQHFLLPNLQITLLGMFWHYHYYIPLPNNEVIWEHRLFFPKARNAGQRFAQEVSRSVQQVVASEDAAMGESNQRGFETAWAAGFPELHDQEIILKHTHHSIVSYMNAASGGEK